MLQRISKVKTDQRILAVASGGGHWEQLVILRDAFEDFDCHYLTTVPGLAERDGIDSCEVVTDCNKERIAKTLLCIWQCARVILKFRPNVIVSTGAAPGLICICIGRLIGSRTIWIDSVANANRLSLSGRLARVASTICLTQWPHLEKSEGAKYRGSVL